MNYVEYLSLFGINAKEIPCIVGNGAPTTGVPGGIGSLYMDRDNKNLYICTSVENNKYTWEPHGNIDDSQVGQNTWSSKKIMEEMSKLTNQSGIIQATLEH